MIGEKFVREEIDHILHLPLIQRLTHLKFRRPMIGIICGVVIMLLSSLLSVSAEYISHDILCVPHFTIDAVAYFFHGCGAVPIIRYIEPFITVIMGE